ncbi:Uncharacterised protein [uncultured Clostridium sp.]
MVPHRAAGVFAMMNWSNGWRLPSAWRSRSGAVCGVSMYPGPMPLHWMLYSPYSLAMFFVSIFRPPFAAAYALTVSRPSSLIMLQMLMIFPCPFSIIPGITALLTMNGAFRSTSTTCRNCAAVISHIGMRLMMPALFTRMSMTPTSWAICFTIACTASSSVTSHT